MNGQKQVDRGCAHQRAASACHGLTGLLFQFPHPDADFFRHNAVRYHFPESDAVPVFPAPQPLPGRLLKNLPLDAAQGTDFRR